MSATVVLGPNAPSHRLVEPPGAAPASLAPALAPPAPLLRPPLAATAPPLALVDPPVTADDPLLSFPSSPPHEGSPHDRPTRHQKALPMPPSYAGSFQNLLFAAKFSFRAPLLQRGTTKR
jgi:hypothetical protein